jgi:hypothetical protein
MKLSEKYFEPLMNILQIRLFPLYGTGSVSDISPFPFVFPLYNALHKKYTLKTIYKYLLGVRTLFSSAFFGILTHIAFMCRPTESQILFASGTALKRLGL